LRNIRVLVLLVRAQSVQRLRTDNTHDPTEDIRLLEIYVDKVSRTIFDMLNSFTNVTNL
jgi:hypothetical protein